MSYRHGHILPVMGEAYTNTNSIASTTPALIAYAALPTYLSARCELGFRGSVTKNNSGADNYEFNICDEAGAHFSAEVKVTVTSSASYASPPTGEGTVACNSDLVAHCATDKFGVELRHSNAGGSYGHYCWSPVLEVRVR